MITMLVNLVITLIDIYSMILFVYVLLSWFPINRGILADIDNLLGKLCDPYLDLFRKLVPPIGGMVDITPVIALIVLQLVARVLVMLF